MSVSQRYGIAASIRPNAKRCVTTDEDHNINQRPTHQNALISSSDIVTSYYSLAIAKNNLSKMGKIEVAAEYMKQRTANNIDGVRNFACILMMGQRVSNGLPSGFGALC